MGTSETSNRSFEEVARHSGEMRDLEDPEPRAIEGEIDATRADMRATLEALERRFSFDRLVDMTVGRIRARGGELASNLTDAATQNPVPLLLTSIGLGWMMLSSRRGSRANGSSYSSSDDYDSGDGTGTLRDGARSVRERAANVRDRAGQAADKVQGAKDSTRETMRSAMDSTRETWKQAAESSRQTVEQTADTLRSGASRAARVTREQADRVHQLFQEQPLLLGALGLAAGAIIGALLPTSEHEDRMLGAMRSKAVKQVAQKGRAKLETAVDEVAAAVRQGRSSEDSAAGGDKPAARPH
jgi:ElaB/YqjD/DUF883 family membrane-anchored ribosome-binding protein